MTSLERLLVAVDGSPKSGFAARLAGLLAASRGMPVTVLGLGMRGPPRLSRRPSQMAPTWLSERQREPPERSKPTPGRPCLRR